MTAQKLWERFKKQYEQNDVDAIYSKLPAIAKKITAEKRLSL